MTRPDQVGAEHGATVPSPGSRPAPCKDVDLARWFWCGIVPGGAVCGWHVGWMTPWLHYIHDVLPNVGGETPLFTILVFAGVRTWVIPVVLAGMGLSGAWLSRRAGSALGRRRILLKCMSIGFALFLLCWYRALALPVEKANLMFRRIDEEDLDLSVSSLAVCLSFLLPMVPWAGRLGRAVWCWGESLLLAIATLSLRLCVPVVLHAATWRAYGRMRWGWVVFAPPAWVGTGLDLGVALAGNLLLAVLVSRCSSKYDVWGPWFALSILVSMAMCLGLVLAWLYGV